MFTCQIIPGCRQFTPIGLRFTPFGLGLAAFGLGLAAERDIDITMLLECINEITYTQTTLIRNVPSMHNT
jgi:hypothetical protein